MSSAAQPESGRMAWRAWVPWALIVLATVIALVSALNVWVKRQALSTDNWTSTSEQLLANDEIRQALSVYLVNQLYEKVDVQAELEARLPKQTKPLAGPIAGALQPALVRATDTLLARPRVQELWKQANRRAHERFIALLDNDNEVLQTTNGNVVLDLNSLVQQVSEQTGLGGRIVERLPPDAGQIVVMKGNQLETARRAVKVVRVLSYFLFFLVIALFAAAVYIARGRRRVLLLGVGASVLLTGLAILVVRRFAGNYLVDALTTNPDDKGAVSAAWTIGTDLLRNTGLNAVLYGVVIIFGAWFAGPSRPARYLRRLLAPTMRDRPVIVYGAVTLVLLLILLAGPTDANRVAPLLVLYALAFAGTEVIRRQTAREFPPPTEATTVAG